MNSSGRKQSISGLRR